MIEIRRTSINKWFGDNGDYTHNINYDLDEKSIIMDLGGYNGIWVQQMIDKYNPHVYILEPVLEYYNNLVNKFVNNNKVKILNIGVSDNECDGVLYQNNDGTSTNFQSGEIVYAKFNTIDYIFNYWNIDLLQINIEGDEYKLLEYMFDKNILNNIKNIQIQFHEGIDNFIERRISIQEKLSLCGFINNFDYPFVWESWKNNNI